ncbi:4'-phosphopantetheinyl transferase A [Penicillium angulare]|uniref:4'-phosphopantetheinyl transferase A n=1 Tax=Penicillium angulare TaxID=116970 RepID=UPI00253FB40E|nr:4'-phosphopantetheinyl transferase A [Penicillium angulare]KAJ5287085.1 4'-phosphopantetheinyl transferase A [Penicillium angulare]
MRANKISLDNAQQESPNVANIDSSMAGLPTTVRWYIDSRYWEANGKDLPLLQFLRPDEQTAVKRYYHAADKRMSLASHLLKYLYIHHACGVQWKEIVLTRTAMPENRPFYKSSSDTQVEFNVTHQAGLTGLAGTIVPSHEQMQRNSTANQIPPGPRLGIDVTCVNENRRRVVKTMHEYLEHVSIFTEVFSDREVETMKNPAAALRQAKALGFASTFINTSSEETIVGFGMRLFYSYWALKEAYLKMTGDALLAPWLRTLEFSNVIPPDPVHPLNSSKPYMVSQDPKHIPQSPKNWGSPYEGVKVSKAGKPLDDVRLQLVAFESDYIVAAAGCGLPVGVFPNLKYNEGDHHLPGHISVFSDDNEEKHRISINTKKVLGDMDPWHIPLPIQDPWLPMQEIDIDLDIRPCAEGRCAHPINNKSVLSCVGLSTPA